MYFNNKNATIEPIFRQRVKLQFVTK